MLQNKIFVITSPNSFLHNFWQEFNSAEFATLNLPYEIVFVNEGDENNQWQIIKQSIAENHPQDLILILTDSLIIQKKAVWLKLNREYPLLIMRWWDTPAYVKKNYINKLIYSRSIAANLYLSRELEKINSASVKKYLRVEQPVHLDQNHLWGESGKYKVFRQVVRGILEPNRLDELGNQKRSFGHIRLSVASHFYCNQDNINTITDLLDKYSKYPKEVLDCVQFVLIDDGSPVQYEIPQYDLNLTWIKINENIAWNQTGARNLALLYSKSNNVIISDVDHDFPAHTLAWLCQRDIKPKFFYKFYCKYNDGKIGKGHPNIFYLSRARFFEMGGVDEEMSGSWGCEDVNFVKNYKYHGNVQTYLPKKYYCEQTKVDRDGSYHSLFRDQSFNLGTYARKRMEGEYYGKNYGHSRMLLEFTWKILANYYRTAPIPKINKKWHKYWLLRQLKTIIFG